MNSQAATEFEPSTEWVNEEDCDTLLIYLPGFVKEQLRVQLRSRTLIISGQRKVNDNSWTRFRKEFLVSEHCDVSKISAKFEGSILYVKQPKSTTRVAPKQEEQPPMNAPTPTPMPEKPMDEPKAHVEEANVKPDSKPTSVAQPDGDSGVGKDVKDGPEDDEEEKDGDSEGKDKELKEQKGVCENASKKTLGGGGLEMVMKLKPSRGDVSKVLVLVTGFVLGVYCAKLIQSWIA
ncbi:hypothetical protein SSX86_028422 [Deinandra increscens subsp. villosa]|uniref:SHSP domain-containing protein n=1 Tax=Deinandra increscens subsp. villosa TaxID=3103831 RepID=A0AAP0GKU2_9ASTR